MADFHANVCTSAWAASPPTITRRFRFTTPARTCPPARTCSARSCDGARARHPRGRPVRLQQDPKEVFDAHPEWFFRKANGEPVIYNGLYSTCINGGYYRDHAMKILAEALERYDVDGLFFNMFGNQSSDYSGNFVGLLPLRRLQAQVPRALREGASRAGRTRSTASSCSAARAKWPPKSAS